MYGIIKWGLSPDITHGSLNSTSLCSLSLWYRERPGLILQHSNCSTDLFPAVPLLTSRLSQRSTAGGHGEPNKEMFTACVIQNLFSLLDAGFFPLCV